MLWRVVPNQRFWTAGRCGTDIGSGIHRIHHSGGLYTTKFACLVLGVYNVGPSSSLQRLRLVPNAEFTQKGARRYTRQASGTHHDCGCVVCFGRSFPHIRRLA